MGNTRLRNIGNLFTTTYVSGDYSWTGTLSPTFSGTSLTLMGTSDGTNNSNLIYNVWQSGTETLEFNSSFTVGSIGGTDYGFATLFKNQLTSTEFRVTVGTATAFNAGTLNILLNGNSVATTNMSSVPAVGNVITVKMSMVANVITALVTNVTKGISNTMTYTMTYNYPFTYFKGISKFGFGFYGGTLSNVTWSVKTDDLFNADLMYIGDSKAWGLCAGGTTTANRSINLWKTANPIKTIYSNSGGNDQSISYVNKLSELLLYKPKKVIVYAPSNDSRTGVSTATTTANLTTVRNALLAIGCDVWYQNPLTEIGANNQAGLITAGASVFPANRIIPEPPTWNTGTDLVADNVHPNTAANIKIYNNQATYITL